jgi:putative ABC transport system permease protein
VSVLFLLGEPIEPKALMRPYGLYFLYRSRLRRHWSQELFAGLGIVIAVALVFATLVASGSIAGSAAQVVHKVIGSADLQLRSQSPEGFDERMLHSVEALPGVRAAAPLLEVPASIVAADGRRLNVTVLGADVALGILDGLAHTVPGSVFSEPAVGLSSASARALQIAPATVEGQSPQRVTVKLRGRAFGLNVSAVLGREAAGALSGVLAAAMPLEVLQALSGLKGRVSRILVQSAPGHRAEVRSELQRLAAGRIAVAPADQDIALLDQALTPGNLASDFFAAVAALLGFLLAFNAVLLTVPERRAQIADLRLAGARETAIVQLLLFQAVCLGVVASLIGLGIGWGLALAAFRQRPGYLAQAFVLGGNVVIGLGPALLAVAGGIAATCLASMVPLADLRRRRALDAIYREEGDPGNAIGAAFRARLAIAALLLLALATAILIGDPSLALVACVAVALACLLAMPLAFAGVIGGGAWVARHSKRLTILPVAVMSLRRTTLRSLALVMTGAVALFGAVALSGARGDLLKGLEQGADAYAAAGEIWVMNPNDVELASRFVPDRSVTNIGRVPGVEDVRALQGGFMDIGDRRVAVFALPGSTSYRLLRSEVVVGNIASAQRRLSESGWITLSQQLASERGAKVGGTVSSPGPSGPVTFRVAALTTNLAWPGGGGIDEHTRFKPPLGYQYANRPCGAT